MARPFARNTPALSITRNPTRGNEKKPVFMNEQDLINFLIRFRAQKWNCLNTI